MFTRRKSGAKAEENFTGNQSSRPNKHLARLSQARLLLAT